MKERKEMWMREEGKMSERKKEKKCGKREKKMREEGKMSSERKKERKECLKVRADTIVQ